MFQLETKWFDFSWGEIGGVKVVVVKVSDNSEVYQGRWTVGALTLNGAHWILTRLKKWHGITGTPWARSHSNGENVDGKYHGFLLDFGFRTATSLRITIPPYHPNGIDIKFIIPNVDEGISGWKTFEHELQTFIAGEGISSVGESSMAQGLIWID